MKKRNWIPGCIVVLALTATPATLGASSGQESPARGQVEELIHASGAEVGLAFQMLEYAVHYLKFHPEAVDFPMTKRLLRIIRVFQIRASRNGNPQCQLFHFLFRRLRSQPRRLKQSSRLQFLLFVLLMRQISQQLEVGVVSLSSLPAHLPHWKKSARTFSTVPVCVEVAVIVWNADHPGSPQFQASDLIQAIAAGDFQQAHAVGRASLPTIRVVTAACWRAQRLFRSRRWAFSASGRIQFMASVLLMVKVTVPAAVPHPVG